MNCYTEVYSDFVGKTFQNVELDCDGRLVFHLSDDVRYVISGFKSDVIRMFHGNLEELSGSPIIIAEVTEYTVNPQSSIDSELYVMVRFATCESCITIQMSSGFSFWRGYKVESVYGEVEQVRILDRFIGKIFQDVSENNRRELIFMLPDGEKYVFYHDQECCEEVLIEDICGNLANLVGSPLIMAEEITHEKVYGRCESTTYTFYKFATAKGYVTVRWCGNSNTFYSENVDFRIVKP